MTTVVANLECMAADQRCTGWGPIGHVTKIYRIGNSLFGLAGNPFLALHMLRWLQGKRDVAALYKLIPEAQREELCLLELSADGLAYWDGWGARLPLLDQTFAIGSGSVAALQALRLGKSPPDAVIAATGMDEYTGVQIAPHVEYLKKRKRG